MAKQTGRCTNYSGCKLAYRKEEINIVAKEFRCPECGSALERLAPIKHGPRAIIVTIGVVTLLLLFTTATVWKLAGAHREVVVSDDWPPNSTPTDSPSPIPESTPLPTVEPSATPSATAEPSATLSPAAEATATPASTAATSGTPTLPQPEIKASEADEVRQAVLQRIELIPKLSNAKKDKLSSALERAHGLCRLFTVSFEISGTQLRAQDVAFVQNEVSKPEVKNRLDDPTYILVILGFADKQGDDQANQSLSGRRAQAVKDILRHKAGLQNVIEIIPMGGTELLDSRDLAKNRVVEVWGASL
jgi:outer membrane protein OmpA-like peptidoglycan-associated protein